MNFAPHEGIASRDSVWGQAVNLTLPGSWAHKTGILELQEGHPSGSNPSWRG